MKYKAYGEAYRRAILPQMDEMRRNPRKYYNIEFLTSKLEQYSKEIRQLAKERRTLQEYSKEKFTLKIEKRLNYIQKRILIRRRKKIGVRTAIDMINLENQIIEIDKKIDKLNEKISSKS